MSGESGSHSDWVAQLDQLLRSLTDAAKVIGSYHQALIEQGLGPTEALALTLGFQQVIFTMGAAPQEEP